VVPPLSACKQATPHRSDGAPLYRGASGGAYLGADPVWSAAPGWFWTRAARPALTWDLRPSQALLAQRL
jgi:hypothetical protein